MESDSPIPGDQEGSSGDGANHGRVTQEAKPMKGKSNRRRIVMTVPARVADEVDKELHETLGMTIETFIEHQIAEMHKEIQQPARELEPSEGSSEQSPVAAGYL
jgi:hypothetical protein